ncbi:PDR/VanB family oxidoreductase [Nocardia fluminea]|uniref:PDR/VanB family oxidoreductase n=1 Tax=Nocardia fluminea TaxID=134984 RepID=UPI00341B4090
MAEQQTLPVRVTGRREVATDVVEFTFGPDTGQFPAWEPGAHVDVILADTTVRQYSLCGNPNDCDTWTIAVFRSPNQDGAARRIVDHLQPGSRIVLQGPRNRFPLIKAERYEFVAGGIGITPLLPMIDAVSRCGVPWHLNYGGRSMEHMAYAEMLTTRYGASVTLCPQDRDGLLDLAGIVADLTTETAVYACGPEGMLSALEGLAAEASWSFHCERFAGNNEVAHRPDDEPFEVTLTSAGITLEIQPGESILDAVEREGVFVMSSCREGICGSCETPVVSGEIDHRDDYLTDEERASGDVMMICVSRGCGALELDL